MKEEKKTIVYTWPLSGIIYQHKKAVVKIDFKKLNPD